MIYLSPENTLFVSILLQCKIMSESLLQHSTLIKIHEFLRQLTLTFYQMIDVVITKYDGRTSFDYMRRRDREGHARVNDKRAINGSTLPREMRVPP